MWDDEDFELSNESIKSEVKKIGVGVVIAKSSE